MALVAVLAPWLRRRLGPPAENVLESRLETAEQALIPCAINGIMAA